MGKTLILIANLLRRIIELLEQLVKNTAGQRELKSIKWTVGIPKEES